MGNVLYENYERASLHRRFWRMFWLVAWAVGIYLSIRMGWWG